MTDSVKLIQIPKGAVRLIGNSSTASTSIAPIKSKEGVWHEFKDGVEKMWIDKTGRRMIEGIASTGTLTSHGHSRNPKGCIVRLPVPLLFGHGFKKGTRERGYKNVQDARIGDVVMVCKSKTAITVRAVLDDSLAGDAAWELIESGEARCFSVDSINGKTTMKGIVNGHPYFDQWELKEVSVCFKGANPDCRFDIVK
jgi:hypothetical protein